MSNSLPSIGDVALAQAQAATNSAAAYIKPHAKASLDAIDKQSKDFESMFMSQMLQPMFEGLDVDPTFGGGHGEEVMRSFLVQEYGKILAENGQSGIAAAVKNEMIRAQEIGTTNQPSASNGAAYAALH